MDTGNVCGPSLSLGCSQALPWLWEIPFPSRIDPAEPHLSFSHFPEGHARCCREVLVPEASTDPWMVSLQQLQLIPELGMLGGAGGASGHPKNGERSRLSLVGITSCCSWGLGLLSHHIFFLFFLRFFMTLKQPGILLNPILRPHCGRIPWVISEPNFSSGLPNFLLCPTAKGTPWFSCPGAAVQPLQFPIPNSCLESVCPPGCVCAGIPRILLIFPTPSVLLLSLLLSCNSHQENCVI